MPNYTYFQAKEISEENPKPEGIRLSYTSKFPVPLNFDSSSLKLPMVSGDACEEGWNHV